MTGFLRSIFSVMVVMFGFASVIAAQDADGEFCVRAFEDLNSNGVSDLNEPPLQRGISANLLDANGIVVASALMDNSPQMARGLMCFQFLSPGQFTIEVSSGDYTATTGSNMTNVVRAGEVPYVMDYGAVRASAAVQAQPEAVSVEAAVPRIALSLAGAVGAALLMTLLGLLIYLLVYRPRLKRAAAAPPDDYYRKPPATGSIPRVTDTAEIRKQ